MGEGQSFITYEQDDFIKQYVSSLRLLLALQSKPSPEIRHLKLEELFLYLLQQNPEKLLSLKLISKDQEDLLLRKVVESHIGKPITVEELAFLCNMSTSTFKRKFCSIYGSSPQKWLQVQKLQLAADLLKNPLEKTSLVYFKIGYENHSSFSQAFRQQYGISPSAFQASHLNVRQ